MAVTTTPSTGEQRVLGWVFEAFMCRKVIIMLLNVGIELLELALFLLIVYLVVGGLILLNAEE